jgi:curved DNA-binding protein CbpA
MPNSDLKDHYEILQVSPRADRDTIERVFRYLANRFHPDNRETGDVERFTEIVDAYEVLSSAVKRAHYDLSYESVREARWKLFNQESATQNVDNDGRLRIALMSILYIVRRNNPAEPGVGTLELERLLECPEAVLKFHAWYLKENHWISRLETGYLAITALGVDKLFELGGPGQSVVPMIGRGNMHNAENPTAGDRVLDAAEDSAEID